MKYLFTQIFISILTVILLKYLLDLDYFVPVNEEGIINRYSVITVLILLFFLISSSVSLIIYLIQKFIAFGIREFPNPKLSLIVSLIVSSIFIFSIILNIYGVLDFIYSLILLSISIIIIYMILFFYGKK